MLLLVLLGITSIGSRKPKVAKTRFACPCNNKRRKRKKSRILDEVCSTNPGEPAGSCMKETYMAIFLAFQDLLFFALNHPNYIAGQGSITTVCSHWKKRILKPFGNIRMVCLVSTEQRNLFQEILSIWHWNKWSVMMQPVRELVLLPWITQHQQANIGLDPIF